MIGKALSGVAALALMAHAAPAQAQVAPPGSPSGVGVQDGTYVYIVRPVEIAESYVERLNLGTAPSGIDAQFMAESQVQASLVRRGNDLCDGDPDGVSDFRVIGMKIFSRDAPFMSGEQESRIFVNQEEKKVAVYLRGDVREWGPGETYCEDGKLAPYGSGRGMLRMAYETDQHVLPLNFTAYPRAWDADQQSLTAVCDRFRSLALAAYAEMNPRFSLINIQSPPGPIDWSVLIPNTPTVPDGMNNGTELSGSEGVFHAINIAEAASVASDAVTLGLVLAAGITGGPAAVGTGLAIWVMGQAIDNAALGVAATGIGQFHAALNGFHQGLQADTSTQAHADYAIKPIQMGETQYAGLDGDYLAKTALDMCDQLDDLPEPPQGYAAGHFSRPLGSIPLMGRGPIPQAPAAFANGTIRPVGGPSLDELVAQARAMGVEVPNLDAIREQLPDGISLNEQPIMLTGSAVSGRSQEGAVYEWNVNYTVEIAPEGERIAEGWFDPRG